MGKVLLYPYVILENILRNINAFIVLEKQIIFFEYLSSLQDQVVLVTNAKIWIKINWAKTARLNP